MSYVGCPACGKTKQRDEPCPHCAGTASRSRAIPIGIIVAVLAGGIAVVSSLDYTPDPATQRLLAYKACREFVTPRLRAPVTAQFAGENEARIADNGNGDWNVSAHVDSQNGFGAMIRTRFACTTKNVNGSWSLVNLDIKD